MATQGSHYKAHQNFHFFKPLFPFYLLYFSFKVSLTYVHKTIFAFVHKRTFLLFDMSVKIQKFLKII